MSPNPQQHAAKRRLSPQQSRKLVLDVARVALRNGEWRLALGLLVWPPGWSHTRLEAWREVLPVESLLDAEDFEVLRDAD
jgi:hypothetical protein